MALCHDLTEPPRTKSAAKLLKISESTKKKGRKNKAMTLTGNRFISSIGISPFKVKRLFSG
jgi:hypothetical protein